MKIETVRPPLLLALALLIATAGSYPIEHVEAEAPVAAPAWDEEEFAMYTDATLDLCEHRTGFVLTVHVACPRVVDPDSRKLATLPPD